jgi:L-alanine-DL-glutamate epimerase-like enolase superfamily enzyme
VNIKLHPYQLEFLFPFRIAHGIRTYTDALFVELDHGGVKAFGEATFPPYLPYTREDAIACLTSIPMERLASIDQGIINLADALYEYRHMQPPALAALDMALWSLKAKLEHKPIDALLGITESLSTPRSYTISVSDREEMSRRIEHGISLGFTFFKLKLDGLSDGQMLIDFRSLSKAAFAVDANQSWTDIGYAIEFTKELQKEGCVLIEQPFDKKDLVLTQRLKAELSIPLIADEACQTIDDIDKIKASFSGINVKLQKCGGISPALEMIRYAKSIGLKVLIGCMSESIIGCSAGEVLSPLCDWNDLDGVYLIKEVPFSNF